MTLSIATLFCPSARSANATMTPMTVPSSPMKGALLPSVPSRVMPRSSSRRRLVISPSIAASSAAGPPCAHRSDARSTSASMLALPCSRAYALSRSPSSSSRHSSSPSSSSAPRLRKNSQRSTIAPIDATDSAISRYRTHELPSMATLSRYLTIMVLPSLPSRLTQLKTFSATNSPVDVPSVTSLASSWPLRENVAWRLPSSAAS